MARGDSTEATEIVVRRLYDYINQNRGDQLATIVAPSSVDHSSGRNGPEGFAEAAANLHRVYANLRPEIADLVAQDHLVAIRWVETGRHVGQFFELKPTGQPFEACGLAPYRVRDGKIVESWRRIEPSTIRAQPAAQEALEAGAGRR